MRKNIAVAMLALVGLLSSHPVSAQATSGCASAPCVKKDLILSATAFGRSLIAAAPSNPNQLVTAVQESTSVCPSRLAVYLSSDLGRTWQPPSCLPTDDDWFVFGEESPSVAVSLDGAIVAAGVYSQEGAGEGLAMHRSADGGASWSEFEWISSDGYFRGLARNAHAVIDTSAKSPFRGSIYVPYTAEGTEDPFSRIPMAVSRDGGVTWSDQRPTPEYDMQADGDNLVDLSSLAIGRDGRLYLGYVHCKAGFRACADDSVKLLLTVSADGGASWSEPRTVATLPQAAELALSRPVLVADASKGPFQGRLYYVASSLIDGRRAVLVGASADRGKTWSEPTLVAPDGSGGQQTDPWASVNDRGELTISWMDSRADANGHKRFQALLAMSTDGGATFTPPVALDERLLAQKQTWGPDLVSHVWVGNQLRAAFHGANPDGTRGVRIGRAQR
jgi:BNR repeat-like domain